ncbi:MAG: GntR family transcriptional regulator [Nocardiopsaceae bacterium]|nr:GntR family transcriptional regulator [Nocardiopsaceae bacterium]
MAEPMYRVIAMELLDEIKTGTLEPGGQLPTELELRTRHQASRNTIRDAVKWLTNRGLVEKKPGKGTFVVERIDPYVTTLSSGTQASLSGVEDEGWAAEVEGRGRTATTSAPRVEVLEAPPRIASRLRVPEGSEVVTRRQERYIDRTPWSLQTTAYPMEYVRRGAADLLRAQPVPGGTISYLRRTLGLEQVGHRDRILLRAPREEEARFLRLPDDNRVWVVSVIRTCYAAGDDGPVPLRVTFTVLPADRNQFVIDSGQVPEDIPGPAID